MDSWKAIYGKVTNVTMQGNNITAFTIKARITNDDAWVVGPWAPGTNSHGESLTTSPYECNLVQPRLTASFALSALGTCRAVGRGPIGRARCPTSSRPNEDVTAWYCWTPENPEPEKAPWGNYYVPTWEFDTVPHGEYRERDMNFTVAAGGLTPADRGRL